MKAKITRWIAGKADRILARWGFRVVQQSQLNTVSFTADQFEGLLSRYGTRLSRKKARGQAVSTSSLLSRVADGMQNGVRVR